MPTIVTILSCVLIGQFPAEQPQAGASIEPMQQATSAEDTRPTADSIPPPVQPENTPTDQAIQSETSEVSIPPKPSFTAVERGSPPTEQPASMRMRPPQLIAEAMTLPQGGAVTGQPLPLVQALSATADRRQQLAITHAYWQTVEEVAKYHYCMEQVNQLGRLQPSRDEEASLQAARSAALAQLREVELTAGSAQHELAALVQIPADAPLPLPADRPHVGAYRTNFQELFASRPAPDRARLIDRTLPIRRMAIDQRAIAIQAAQDALAAAIDAHHLRQGSLTGVISCSSQLAGQQRAFIETVCRYNHDIAEYAIIVAAPGATPQVLVGFMIKTAREPGQSLSAEAEGGVRPAALNEPSPTFATGSGTSQSTIAPRSVPAASAIPTVPPAAQWGPSASPVKNEPTLAPPRDGTILKEKKEPTPAPPRGLAPIGAKNEPTLAPPRSEPKPKADNQSSPTPSGSEEPAKIRTDSGDPFIRRVQKVNKPVTDSAEGAAGASATSTAIYPALIEAAPPVRAKQLAIALHWDRSLPDGAGRPMTLDECLSRQTGGDRRATVEAFWIARQRAAEYQTVSQEIEILDNLTPAVIERRAKPDGAAEMLFLRAARQNAKANLQEAHAALIEAQFELAIRTQSAGESAWPLPSTPPHAGQYLLNLESQPRSLVQSWPMRHLASAIPAYCTSLQDCAASVVAADAARAKAVEKYSAGNLPVEQVLEEVVRQTRQTFDFLQALTDYNRSIAQYALAVLPPDASPTRITSSLVVAQP